MTNIIAKFLMTITFLISLTPVIFAGNQTSSELARYRVEAYQTRIHQYFLTAGTKVNIELVGDGYTDLDFYIYDSYGNFITKKENRSDIEIANLNVYRSEYFTVKVVNRNNDFNEYDLKVWEY